MSNVRIEQFQIPDEPALLSFLPDAYPDEPRKSEPDFWRWHFLENPYASRDNVPLWVAKDGERVVGQISGIPIDLKVGEEIIDALWMCDLVVLPHYRGQKLGTRLYQAGLDAYPTSMVLGFNEGSGSIMNNLNWVSLGGLHRYQKLLNPGDAFTANVEPIRRLTNLAYAPFRPRPAVRSNIRLVHDFDSSFDLLWEKAKGQWICAAARRAAYLQWQFKQQPRKRFDVLAAYEKDELAGYIVLFFRKDKRADVSPKAAISDIFYDINASPTIIDDLLNGALRLALERRTGTLVIDVLDHRVEERVKQLGFWRIKSAPELIASAPPELQNLLYNPENWFLTRADSDVSIFELPNA